MTEDKAAAFIELRDVVKAYGDNVILQGIDLGIRRGEFLVLVGPSGCGKSTLLRCIAGLEEITSGSLFIDGRLSNRVHPKDRDLAMVFQSYALYPHLTVEENLGFSLSVRKMPKDEVRRLVAETAERLGLSPLLSRYPKQLSGGQRQRVAVGRAIVRQPNAFLFDEPLSNLDAALRSLMRVELKKLHRDLATTMIYVTHDQVEAMTLADRIVVLEGGIIQQIGTPGDLFNTPANRFVAHFIGSPPMNFFPATFDAGAATATAPGLSLTLPDAYRALHNAPSEVIVGVRPAGLQLDGDGGAVEGVVEVVEPVGGESYVHVRVGESPCVAQIDAAAAARLTPEREVTFRVAPAQVYLFDRHTEAAIRPS
ncbi:MAG: sn-glycerol-3-phosphate ABC transporter ATP-binding protein UgpC [Candidatus Lernaella stagnicola]|nr:sn-glycerol-3-phosphate ABC transporter ATP-binding protein UgpC [Candidatus Lernaella stagnicola]